MFRQLYRSYSRRAFTMVELLAAVAIIAVLTTTAIFFVGSYIKSARKVSAERTVLILNEALNEYRTLGGIAYAHSLEGNNSITMNGAVVDAMIAGFTRFGRFMNFAKEQPKFAISALGSSGQGQHFRFILDEVELERWSSGPPPKSDQSTQVAITPSTYTVLQGSSLTFTASGGDGTGEYTWGGDEGSGTGASKTITFNTAGTRTVTVYKASDGNYNESTPVVATITVGTSYAVSTFAGQAGSSGTTDGIGTAAKFIGPMDMCYHGGYLYVVDGASGSKVRRINLATREVETLFASQSYYYPEYIATDGHYVYIGGTTGIYRGVIGDSTAPLWIYESGNDVRVMGMKFYNGYLYYVRYGGDKLYRTDNNKNIELLYAEMHPGTTNYTTMDIDIADDGTIYLYQPPRLYKTTIAGAPVTALNELAATGKMALGPDGKIYQAHRSNQVIYRTTLPASGAIYSGANNSSGYVDGALLDARYKEPRDVEFDDQGNLYVAEKANYIIRKIGIQ